MVCTEIPFGKMDEGNDIMVQSRVTYVDVFRGLGILLMVMGHCKED